MVNACIICVIFVCVVCVYSGIQVCSTSHTKKLKRKQRIHDHDFDSMRLVQRTLKHSVYECRWRVRGEFTTYGTTSTYAYVRVHCIHVRRIRIRTLVNNTAKIHCDGKLETANIRSQNRVVSTHFESFRLNFLIYPSKNVILCWWYMHHITSEILTFHLSPTLSELRWRVWRWMAKPSHVQWLFSLPSVAWDDFART